MAVKIFGNKVIVKPKAKETQTASGFLLPETVIEKQKGNEGEIIVMGNGPALADLGLKVGDKVIFTDFLALKIEVEGEECFVVRHDDILAIVEEG